MTLNTEVRCTCDQLLETTDSINTRNDTIEIVAEPCKDCMKSEGESQYQKGYDKGYEDAESKQSS